jgi:23S rRNA (uracil1939-C5)-methyltransferase
VTAVQIREIAAGGDGVGRLAEGMTVFVPRTAPGDQVEITVTTRKARYARGRVVRVEAPSPLRAAPPCRHYVEDDCGGCQLQHLVPPAQLEAKRAIVREALRRIGHLPVESVEIVPPAQPLRYRTTVTLAIGADGRIGLHPWDRPDQVFDLDDCLIATPAVMGLWRALRPHAALLPRGATHLVLREDRSGGGHLVVRGGTPPWEAGPLARALGGAIQAVWWEPRGGAPRVVAGPTTGFPAVAFAQGQPVLADRIRRDAVEALGEVRDQIVWDLYGGAGDGARSLAARGARVWSVEVERTAVDWAARQPAPPGSPVGSPAYVDGRVEEVLHRLPGPAAVLLNPPRTGAGARVTGALDRLARHGPLRRVAYVSCDPATLARDLSRLGAAGGGLRLAAVRAYDLFPQTSHVETLAVLEAG